MGKTLVSILITFGIIIGATVFELVYVNQTFAVFREALVSLYHKTEADEATRVDGAAVREYWEQHKRVLHLFLPHTPLQEVDYHLNEALGYLYENNFEDTLPKIELLLDLTENIPHSNAIIPENIF